jgi:hypothetical protein
MKETMMEFKKGTASRKRVSTCQPTSEIKGIFAGVYDVIVRQFPIPTPQRPTRSAKGTKMRARRAGRAERVYCNNSSHFKILAIPTMEVADAVFEAVICNGGITIVQHHLFFSKMHLFYSL